MTLGQYQRHLAEFPNGNLGASATLDFHANGVFQSGVLNSAACALSFVNPREHGTIWIELIQDATGGRAVTFPGSVVGTAPLLNTAANASTLLELMWNGTNYQFASASRLSAPFRATFYVDPAFTGPSNGSQSNPYPSITTAITAAPSTGALIVLAPTATTTENVTIPSTGTWEISAEGKNGATILGNVSCGGTSDVISLTNLSVTGTISGNATGAGHRYLILTNTSVGGAMSLTVSSGGAWAVSGNAPGAAYNSVNGSVAAVSVDGSVILMENMTLNGAFGVGTGSDIRLIGCQVGTGSVAVGATTFVQNCIFTTAVTFTGAGSIVMDGHSHANALAAGGITLAGGATLTIRNDVTLTGIQQSGATSGQVPTWSGTAWVASTVVSAVLSVFGRTGAVVAAVGDYAASKITNDSSTVAGAHVSDALDALKALIAASVTGVSSVYGRTGAVIAAVGDYAASQVTNDSTVTGTGVAAALNTLKASIAALVTGVSSFKTRTGAITPAAGDYAASQVNNDSATVTGTHVSDALDALKALIAASVTGVSSVYGRTGAVIAAAGDYAASKINNDSATVSGTHVSDALDALKAISGVVSFATRSGAVTPASGDYAASQVTNDSTVIGTGVSGALNTLKAAIAALVASSIGNDSSVTGTTVKDALNTLKTSITALVTGVSSFNTRTGAVVPASGDYTTTLITNSSSVVGGNGVPVATTDTGALNDLLLEFPNGFYGKVANFTLSNANIGQVGLISAAGVICTIPTLAASGIAQGSKFSFILYGATATIASVVGISGAVTVHVPVLLPTAQFSRIDLECIGSNEWRVTGSPLTMTADDILNASAVSGFTVKDALNTLNAHSLTGWLNVPLNQRADASSSFNPMPFYSATGYTTFFANSDYLNTEFPVLPDGLSIDQVQVTFCPATGLHGGALPGKVPQFAVYAQVAGSSPTLVATASDPSTGANYETPHVISTGSFGPVSTTNTRFFIYFESEGVSNNFSGARLTSVKVHVPG